MLVSTPWAGAASAYRALRVTVAYYKSALIYNIAAPLAVAKSWLPRSAVLNVNHHQKCFQTPLNREMISV